MLDADTFLTILYVIVDDLCQPHASEQRRPGPPGSLSESEVIALAIFARWSRFSSERDFYRYAVAHLRAAFPTRNLETAGYPYDYDLLHGGAARRLEPALSENVVGALHAKGERHVRPESLIAGLAEHLARGGTRILEHEEVLCIESHERGRWIVRTPDDVFPSDAVLVAAGAWSKGILASAGVRLPLEGARGCSLTAKGSGRRPRLSLKLADAQVACTPFEDGVRVSGTFDLNGMDQSLDRRRLEAVLEGAAPYLADFEFGGTQLEWAGLRLVTPDDLPFIGPVPGKEGLYVATGHGTLGITLAPATGKALARLSLRSAECQSC